MGVIRNKRKVLSEY